MIIPIVSLSPINLEKTSWSSKATRIVAQMAIIAMATVMAELHHSMECVSQAVKERVSYAPK